MAAPLPMITIRAAIPADVPVILEYMRREDALDGTLADFVATETDLHRLLFDPREDAEACVSELGGRTTGMMIFSRILFSGDGKSSIYLSKLFVEELARGQGIGTKLMEHLVQLAKDRNYARVFWGTNKPNARAHAFYQRFNPHEEDAQWFYIPASKEKRTGNEK